MTEDRVASADEGATAGWRRFLAAGLASAAAAALLAAGVTAAVDPYWIFRSRPPWLTSPDGGVNRLLDVEMRRAKPLQYGAWPSGPVLLGSSVVYRGLRPDDLAVPAGYNLGLSSLMAAEWPTVAALVAARASDGPIVIGLDFFMFTNFPGPPPLDPALATAAGRLQARFSAALSLRALAGSVPGVLAGAYEPGEWRADGFKMTPDYPASVTQKVAAEEASRIIRYRPDAMAHLRRALALLAGRDVHLYLSPVSAAQRRIMAAGGRDDGFQQFRRDAGAAAAAAGLPFLDLSEDHPFADFDPRAGSSAHWLDTVHFKPDVGRWVLTRLNLASVGQERIQASP